MASIFFKPNGERETHSTRYNHHQGGADAGPGEQLNREEHTAQRNGRKWFSLGGNKIDQTDHLDAVIRQHAQPDADRLHRASPTRANFPDVEPSSWNVEKIKHITFTADKPHGFGHGCAGRIEVLDDYRVRVHK